MTLLTPAVTLNSCPYLLEGSVLPQKLLQFALVKVDDLQPLGQEGELQSHQASGGQAALLVGQAVLLGGTGQR